MTQDEYERNARADIKAGVDELRYAMIFDAFLSGQIETDDWNDRLEGDAGLREFVDSYYAGGAA